MTLRTLLSKAPADSLAIVLDHVDGVTFLRCWATPRRLGRRSSSPLRHPSPAGVRASSSGARQLAYQHETTGIDLSVDLGRETGRMSLTGQVLAQRNRGLFSNGTILVVFKLIV